jgi:hypothetical protein
VDTDAVYGRLLATPGWFYTNGMGRDWKDVVESLTGQSTSGSTPLYAAVLRAMATQLLSDDVTAHRGLALLLSLASVSGHWGLNLVQVYQKLAARFEFTVVVTAEAAELADHPRVPNNTFSIAIHGDRTLGVRLTAGQRGGALISMDDEQLASWVALRDNLRRHAAEIEDEIAGIGRLQRDVRYDREAGRHRRQEAVNSTMDWAGPSGKRLRGSVTGEATGLKRQRVGAPAMYTDLVAEHAHVRAGVAEAGGTLGVLAAGVVDLERGGLRQPRVHHLDDVVALQAEVVADHILEAGRGRAQLLHHGCVVLHDGDFGGRERQQQK